MSGSTIGGVIGGTIGFVVGGPFGAQIGFMVGSLAGSIIDPQTIQGAKWNNQTIQGSHDGLGRAVVLGTATVVGNLLDSEPKPRIGTKTERQGKGGPEVERDTAILTYAIEICDSSELRGTSVEAVIAVWEDEKLVYDLRPGAKVSAADSAKWKANKTFYYGREDQSPPSELVAIHGVGNVPAYRGTCLMAVLDEDLMVDIKDNPRGRMSTYRFLVSMCGVTGGSEFPANDILVTGSNTTPGGAVFASAPATAAPTFTGIPVASGADISGASPAYYGGTWLAVGIGSTRYADSLEGPWTTGTLSFPRYGADLVAGGPDGWVAQSTERVFGDGYAVAPVTPTAFSPYSVTRMLTSPYSPGVVAWFAMLRYTGGYWWADQDGTIMRSATLSNTNWEVLGNYSPDGIVWFHDVEVHDGEIYATCQQYILGPGARHQLRKWNGTSWVIVIDNAYGGLRPWQLKSGGDTLLVYCWGNTTLGEYVYTSADNFATAHATGISAWTDGVGPYETEKGRQIEFASGRFYLISGDGEDPAKADKCVVTEDGITFGSPIDLPIKFVIGIAASTKDAFTGIELPDSPGHYIDPETGALDGPTLGEALTCDIPLDQVVRTIWALGAPQLTDDDFDLDSLADDTVRGYVVQDPNLNAADACEPLRKVWTFDLPSYDLKIRARKRGGAVDFTVDDADLVVGENETERSLRGQTVEYPKKLHVGYNDPHLDYKPTTQISERYSASLNVFGEEAFDSLLVLSADEAKQAAEKMLKVLWTELEDNRSFSLPLEYLKAAPADLFTYNDRRYRIEQMRIEGQRIVIESAMYDRASAYTSNATGTQGQAPPSPGTGLRGPTDALLMNAPVLADANDKPGITWAAAGYPGMNWRGAVLQVQRGSEWLDLGQITQACGVGTLLADLPAFDGTFDTVNTLQLRANEDIDSITFAALLAEGNPLAILRPDGRTEILQVQLATETSPGVYDCTNLVRGRLDTANAAHLAGARVAILDSRLGFAQLRYDDAGKTLNFRAVSNGTDPDAAQVQTLTLSPMEGLREWQPWNVTVTPWYSGNETDGGSGYCVSWIGRARLGTDLTPVHSQNFAGYRVSFSANGETYAVDTYEQSVCVSYATLAEHFGPSFPWPDVTVTALSKVPNVDEEPVDPVTPPPAPGGQTSTGAPAAGSLGPNGGFPDNTPYPIPEPTTFGTDVIEGGGFSSAGDISDWRDSTGAPLDSRWSIVDGRLCFHGIGVSTAYYWPERRTMAQQVIPHYSYEITAEIESDAGAKARIGIATGYSTAGATVTLQDGVYGTPATEYGEPTVVSHTYADDRTSYGATGNGQTVFVIVAPAVQARVESAQMARVYFDNVTFEVSENAPATTPFAPSNIDFSSGLAGWVQYPAASAMSPSPTVSSGEATFTPVSEYGTHKYLICTDPITSLDALDKWLRISAEVNCNDPTVVGGFTRGGVGLSYAISTDGGVTYEYTAWANPVERGDWTERFRWMRRSLSGAGITYHACILFKAAVGYRSSVRSISLDVTDAPVT